MKFNLVGKKPAADLIEIDGEAVEPELSWFYTEQIFGKYSFFLDEDITSPNKYRNLINALLNATENDIVEILFNSGGGRLDSATAIVSAIRHSNATVVGVITGGCYSAASMIALSCDELYIDPHGTMMIHSASYGTSGAHKDIANRAGFEEMRMQRIYNDIYDGFLTPEEIEAVSNGQTMWMQAEEVEARLDNRAQYTEDASDYEGVLIC